MISPPPPAGVAPLSRHDQRLMDKARDLEASFLSEMLKYAGLDKQGGSFSGGVGEEQFGSFLREAQARQMVDKGGIGLAESLFQALSRREHGTK